MQSTRTLGSASWTVVISGANQSLCFSYSSTILPHIASFSFAYPYDRSEGRITFAMSNNDTVGTFNTTQGTFLVNIMGAVITDSILNYQTDISSIAVCTEPDGCQLDITLQLQRPGLVKAIVILTVFINCEYRAEALCRRLLISTTSRAHHTIDMHTHW